MAPPVEHSESWVEAFKLQANRETLARVDTFAAWCAVRIEKKLRCCEPLIARELAQDAVVDTLEGKVTWDPEKAPLVAHLCQVIRSRTSRELRRATRFNHVSIERDYTIRLDEDICSAVGPRTSCDADRASLAVQAQATLDRMRNLAVNDAVVLRLLGAFAAGITDRKGVMELTGMSRTAYENGMRRLRRLAKRVPRAPDPA